MPAHPNHSNGRRLGVVAALAAAGLLSGACTFVPLAPEGESVSLMTEAQVADCERVGKTTTKVAAKVIGLPRSKKKVNDELATLARNEAAKKGGNAVVAEGDVVEGSRDFGIYKCP